MSSLRARILNGPLAGREIDLPQGALSIGGPESDLAIPLELGVQTTITIQEDGCRLEPLVPCWIDGMPMVLPQHSLPLGVALDIAGCGIALGHAQTPLDHLVLAPRRAIRKMPFWVWPVFASLLLVLLLAIALTGWQAAHDGKEQQRRRREVATEQVLTALKAAGVTVRIDASGIYQLQGTCVSSSALEPLRGKLRQLQHAFQDNLICDEDLLHTVRNTLAMNGYPQVDVRQGAAAGTVEIEGAITGDARWQKSAGMLAAIPGLRNWSVTDGSGRLVRDLIARLRDAGLLGKVSVVRSKDALLVTGHLDDSQLAVLKRVVDAFAAGSSVALRVIHQNIAPNAAQASLLPAPMVSFGGNAQSAYVDLSNGMRLRIGARLPNGYEVVALDANGIDLLKQDELVHLPLPI